MRTITGLATGNHVADLHLTYLLVSTSASGPLEIETSMFSGVSVVVTDRLMRTMTHCMHRVKRVFEIPRVIPPNRAKSPDRPELSTCFTQPCTQPPTRARHVGTHVPTQSGVWARLALNRHVQRESACRPAAIDEDGGGWFGREILPLDLQKFCP